MDLARGQRTRRTNPARYFAGCGLGRTRHRTPPTPGSRTAVSSWWVGEHALGHLAPVAGLLARHGAPHLVVVSSPVQPQWPVLWCGEGQGVPEVPQELRPSGELQRHVDFNKVDLAKMKQWVSSEISRRLGFEDEIVISMVHTALDDKVLVPLCVACTPIGTTGKRNRQALRQPAGY
eukprot:scaffold324_cov394-Prasinococcus_capsulatus_cf.AAC.17